MNVPRGTVARSLSGVMGCTGSSGAGRFTSFVPGWYRKPRAARGLPEICHTHPNRSSVMESDQYALSALRKGCEICSRVDMAQATWMMGTFS